MVRVPVRGRVVVGPDPVEGDHGHVVVAHDGLADVVDAVLVVTLVHDRHGGLGGLHRGEGGYVVVLPDVVQAVDVVRAGRGCEIAAADGSGELDRVGGVSCSLQFGGGDADEAVWRVFSIYLFHQLYSLLATSTGYGGLGFSVWMWEGNGKSGEMYIP